MMDSNRLGGFAGRVLLVDLGRETVEKKELTRELAENFLGGYGIGAKVLYEMMPPGADPLGPQSVLGFVTGLANGTKAYLGARYTLVHKSPITGGWNDANSGGYFGPELKKAGYDAVFITGISPKPVYLWINDGHAEIRDASHLWGRDTKETLEIIQRETGDPKVRVAAIGPSGEAQSLLSCPINDGHRAPARGGGGAVMGSKKLKAVAVRGTGTVDVAHPDKIAAINKRIRDIIKENPFLQTFAEHGTAFFTESAALSGDSPVKNWAGVGLIDYGEEGAGKLNIAAFDRYKKGKFACTSCPIGCGAHYSVPDGRWPLADTDRPEYETIASFGTNLLCSEVDAIIKCNDLCNRYGLDTISTGMTIAWAMECYDRGVLKKEELDGLELSWGNGEAVVELVRKMAEREGCGAVLANGSAYAAATWGKGAEYLQTASGIELPMHDPRFAPGYARTYQYDPTPGRHVKGGLGILHQTGQIENKYDYTGTGDADLQNTVNQEIINCAGFCNFRDMIIPAEVIDEFISAITGLDFGPEERQATGLRILNLRQAFNLREGIRPADLTISDRAVGNPPLQAGPLEGVTIDSELLFRNFYQAAGWDLQTGKPSEAALQKLGHLDEVIKDLYR